MSVGEGGFFGGDLVDAAWRRKEGRKGGREDVRMVKMRARVLVISMKEESRHQL